MNRLLSPRRHFHRLLSSTTATNFKPPPPPPPPPPRLLLLLRLQLRYLLYATQGFFLLHLFWSKLYCIGATAGPSMVPTINAYGDYIVISKSYSKGRDVKVGDVVSYVHPVDGPGVNVCKRVVGMPGDWVCVDPLAVVGRSLAGAGGGVAAAVEGEMVQVPQGHCWTAGDNLPYSRDSRHYGPVPLALLRGKVVARMWPDPKFFKNPLEEVD